MENEEIQHVYAGFWARLSAYFLDTAIIAVFMIVSITFMKDRVSDYFTAHPEMITMLQNNGYGSDTVNAAEYTSKFMYYYGMFFGLVFNWVYFAGFESSYLGATPGKWALGIYVTDMEGKRVSFGRATGRYFGKIVSGIILGIGYMMAGFTEKFQALHDMMAECLVWKK